MTINKITDLPEGWALTKIEDISETTSGGTPSRKNKNFFTGNIPWLKSGELGDNLNINSAEEAITQQALDNSSAKIISKGSLLLALYGATVGKLGILGIDAAINQAVCAIQPYHGVNARYLFYYLSSYRKNFLNARKGGAQPNISQGIVKATCVPLAPTPEQERIVGRVELLFSFLDAGVAQLRLVQGQLKRYRQAVLKAAFEGKLTQQWRSVNNGLIESTNQLLEKNKQNRIEKIEKKYDDLPSISTKELHELPTSWVWIRLGEIVRKIQYGTSEKASIEETGIPVLRMGNLKDGKIVFDKLKYFPKNWQQLSEFLLNEGDVLFNRTNSAELVGKTAVYKEIYPKTVFASYLIRVQTDKTIYLPELLSYFINSVFGRKYVASVVSQQVGQANVNGTKLALMPIPFMSIQEQVLIRQEIERCFSLADVTEVEVNQSLKQTDFLRQSILKNAFEGKLVFQDPSDEPAEKLLERIKVKRLSNISKNNNRVELSEYVK